MSCGARFALDKDANVLEFPVAEQPAWREGGREGNLCGLFPGELDFH